MKEEHFLKPIIPQPCPDNISKKKSSESTFEKNERPKYRYFYHGTFEPLLKGIEKDGFKFREYYPTLTLSPIYAFRFLERTIKKGGSSAKNRGRYLNAEEQEKFESGEIQPEDSLLLIIEPTPEYKAQSTNEGKPNIFSTPDQIPDDIDETIRTRIWDNYQHTLSREPILRKNDGDIKYPGMHINNRRSANGEWIKLEKEKQITNHSELPVSSLKMVVKKELDFLKIFQDMGKNIQKGEKIDLTIYRERLADYFKNGKGIIRKEPLDEQELIENMVTGELEHLIVTTIRKLYLDLERFRGKKFVNWKTNKEENNPIKTREQLIDQINKLRLIAPENNVFRRYIEICTNEMEKELMN